LQQLHQDEVLEDVSVAARMKCVAVTQHNEGL
jgi:hypothetical protein